jgi:hypothetical protein
VQGSKRAAPEAPIWTLRLFARSSKLEKVSERRVPLTHRSLVFVIALINAGFTRGADGAIFMCIEVFEEVCVPLFGPLCTCALCRNL